MVQKLFADQIALILLSGFPKKKLFFPTLRFWHPASFFFLSVLPKRHMLGVSFSPSSAFLLIV
jgi:hypothetical protein